MTQPVAVADNNKHAENVFQSQEEKIEEQKKQTRRRLRKKARLAMSHCIRTSNTCNRGDSHRSSYVIYPTGEA